MNALVPLDNPFIRLLTNNLLIQAGDFDTLKGRAKIKVWIHDRDQQHQEE